MKCTETVTLRIESYELMKNDIKIKDNEIIRLKEDLMLVIRKNKGQSYKVFHEYGYTEVFTDSEELINSNNVISSKDKEVCFLKEEVEDLNKRLKQIKQTSILWGLIKFNKRK